MKKDKFYKCVCCDKTYLNNNGICPKCKSDDNYELKENNSKVNWNYINACFND